VEADLCEAFLLVSNLYNTKAWDVILAKLKAFLYHIINQHKDLPNQLFNKCAHGLIITPRVFFDKRYLYFLFWLI